MTRKPLGLDRQQLHSESKSRFSRAPGPQRTSNALKLYQNLPACYKNAHIRFPSTIVPAHLLLKLRPTLTLIPLTRRLITKQIRRDLPHLHLLTPLRNSISPKMPPDMLERIMPAIPIPAMHLNRPVRCLTAQSVGVVVAHSDLMP